MKSLAYNIDVISETNIIIPFILSEVILIKMSEFSTCRFFMEFFTNSTTWRFFMTNHVVGFKVGGRPFLSILI